jgi:hypothetical protein
MRELVAFFGQEEICLVSEACNHPDLRGEKRLSYFIGSLAYRMATGEYPFSGITEEEIRYEIRNRATVSPVYKNPKIKKQVAEQILDALGHGKSPAPHLDSWEEALGIWIEDGVKREVSDEEAQRIVLEGKSIEEKSTKRIKRKVFWEKNRFRYLAITGISVVAGAILWTTLGNTVFRTRLTHGFTPLKVVESYYESMDTLDVMMIGDCVTGNAGKSEVETVMNLYVISKPVNPYDTSFQFVSAAEWDKKGRPKLEASATLYGITRPRITEISSVPIPVFLASYERWYTEKDPESEKWQLASTIHGTSIEEKLYLKLVGKDWLIYRIDRLREEQIPSE